jgi:hypothetical protein
MIYMANPRPRAKHPGVMTFEDFTAVFPAVHRATGHLIGGMFREVEAAGYDEQRVEIRPRDARADRGQPATHGWARITIKRSNTELRKHMRVMREEDDVAILAIDAEIEGLKLRLQETRKRRAEAVKTAWRRGTDVALKDVVDRINQKETN